MTEEVIAEAPAEEVIQESAAQPTEDSTAEPEQEQKPESKPEKTFTQEELDAIVKKRLAKEERRVTRLAQAEAENRMLRKQLEQQAPEPEQSGGKPQPSQFNDYESYIEALTDWKTDQKMHDLRQESEAKQRQRAEAERAEHVQTKLAAASSKYDDFEEVALDPNLPISQAMAEVIAESEIGGDLAYYLGSHRDEAMRIAKLSPVQQMRELVTLEAKISQPQVVKSSAPKPITPINTTKSTATGLSDEISMDEWVKRRNAQVFKPRR